MKNSRLLTILLAIAAALVLLAGAIALPILCRPFYYAHIGPLHLTEQTGLTEEEIRTCMRGTQFGKRRKRRMRIELVVFSALLLGFLVFFFLKRNPDNLFFATVCAAMIFIMIFLPDIRIKQDAKRNANGKEICMEIYPHKIEMGRGENQWEIPLDGSCKSAIYQKNIVVYFKGDDMVILPMRCVEPSVLPEVRAMIQAGTQPRED